MNTESEPHNPPWQLVAVIEVDKSERVPCQCNDCGLGLFAGIHMIRWPDGRIECWGSTCFERELGYRPRGRKPLFTGARGRRLTAAERDLLRDNRDRLIEAFKVEWDRHIGELKAVRESEARESEMLQREYAGWLSREQASHPGPGAPRPRSRRIPGLAVVRPIAHIDPSHEPMDDPMYREIRDTLAKRWESQGRYIHVPFWRSELIRLATGIYNRKRRNSAGL